MDRTLTFFLLPLSCFWKGIIKTYNYKYIQHTIIIADSDLIAQHKNGVQILVSSCTKFLFSLKLILIPHSILVCRYCNFRSHSDSVIILVHFLGFLIFPHRICFNTKYSL